MSGVPDKRDAPFYSEAELDALEAVDPAAAARIARGQHAFARRLAAEVPAGAAMPAVHEAHAVLDEVRAILARDGGDIELVAIDGDTLRVRLKGACAGCPRSAFDLKQVVEALVRRRFPAVRRVDNVF